VSTPVARHASRIVEPSGRRTVSPSISTSTSRFGIPSGTVVGLSAI
jgi:hypothetical protein